MVLVGASFPDAKAQVAAEVTCEPRTPFKPLGLRDQRRSVATIAKTVAKALNSTRRTWTTLEYRPSLRPVTDGPGRVAHSYGSAFGTAGAAPYRREKWWRYRP
jgi:hypothetical protein